MSSNLNDNANGLNWVSREFLFAGAFITFAVGVILFGKMEAAEINKLSKFLVILLGSPAIGFSTAFLLQRFKLFLEHLYL